MEWLPFLEVFLYKAYSKLPLSKCAKLILLTWRDSLPSLWHRLSLNGRAYDLGVSGSYRLGRKSPTYVRRISSVHFESGNSLRSGANTSNLKQEHSAACLLGKKVNNKRRFFTTLIGKILFKYLSSRKASSTGVKYTYLGSFYPFDLR